MVDLILESCIKNKCIYLYFCIVFQFQTVLARSWQWERGRGEGGGGRLVCCKQMPPSFPWQSCDQKHPTPMWYIVRSGSRVVQREFFFMRVFLDFTFYKGLLRKTDSKSYWSTYSNVFLFIIWEKQRNHWAQILPRSPTSENWLLKITADLHASQSAIAFRPTIHHPQWLLNVDNVLWNSEASTQFGCLSSFFCLCTPCHRSGCRVWVIRDQTTLLTLESWRRRRKRLKVKPSSVSQHQHKALCEENATASENEEWSLILAHVFQLSRLIGDVLFPECEESGLWVTVPQRKKEFRLET